MAVGLALAFKCERMSSYACSNGMHPSTPLLPCEWTLLKASNAEHWYLFVVFFFSLKTKGKRYHTKNSRSRVPCGWWIRFARLTGDFVKQKVIFDLFNHPLRYKDSISKDDQVFPTYISGGSRSVPLDFLALGSNVLAGSPATLHNPLHCFDRSGPCNSSRSGSRGCRADPRRACRTFSQRRFRLRTLSTLRGLDNCSRLVHLTNIDNKQRLGIHVYGYGVGFA